MAYLLRKPWGVFITSKLTSEGGRLAVTKKLNATIRYDGKTIVIQ
jgi:hypothetical protein